MLISVIIPAYRAEATIERCLRSLSDQSDGQDYEVIVVDSSEDTAVEAIANQFPRTRLVRLPGRSYPGDARNAGVAAASGEILAFTDADCTVDRDWIQEIRRWHESPMPVIGGAIANGNPEQAVGWAYYLCKFTPWLPGSEAGPKDEIPTPCLTMKRWVFERCGPFLEGTYSSDSVFSWKVQRALGRPFFTPSMQVSHINPVSFRHLLTTLYERGRVYARLRASTQDFGGIRRIVCAAGSIVLPMLLFRRIAARVHRSGVYRGQLRANAHLVLAGLVAWSIGESRGYVASGGPDGG